MRIGLFVPCFVDSFYPQVGIATLRLLESLGFHPEYPEEQTCCGQPHFNTGKLDEARELAERFCEVFSPYDMIVCPSGSCTAMVRCHYPSLLDNPAVSKRVVELCEFLIDHVGVTHLTAELKGRAALHIGCHARREIHIAQAVESLLGLVSGLKLVRYPSETWCCGFGGTFSVKYPEISTAMGNRKLEPILVEDVDYLISTDSSCLMHLGGLLARQGKERPKLLHVAELLAAGLEAS